MYFHFIPSTGAKRYLPALRCVLSCLATATLVLMAPGSADAAEVPASTVHTATDNSITPTGDSVPVDTPSPSQVPSQGDPVDNEPLQPLPPLRNVPWGSLDLPRAQGSSGTVCTRLEKSLADVKAQWDDLVATGDFNAANLLRIDYTNMAASIYQCYVVRKAMGS